MLANNFFLDKKSSKTWVKHCRIVEAFAFTFRVSVLLNFPELSEMLQTGHSLETFRYWQTCHHSWVILQCLKSTPVRYHIIPHEFNSDPNFKDTFATNSVLIQIPFLDLTKEDPSSACDQTGQIFWQSCLFERQILNVIQILRLKSP